MVTRSRSSQTSLVCLEMFPLAHSDLLSHAVWEWARGLYFFPNLPGDSDDQSQAYTVRVGAVPMRSMLHIGRSHTTSSKALLNLEMDCPHILSRWSKQTISKHIMKKKVRDEVT